jgi:hypothetical protein
MGYLIDFVIVLRFYASYIFIRGFLWFAAHQNNHPQKSEESPPFAWQRVTYFCITSHNATPRYTCHAMPCRAQAQLDLDRNILKLTKNRNFLQTSTDQQLPLPFRRLFDNRETKMGSSLPCEYGHHEHPFRYEAPYEICDFCVRSALGNGYADEACLSRCC